MADVSNTDTCAPPPPLDARMVNTILQRLRQQAKKAKTSPTRLQALRTYNMFYGMLLVDGATLKHGGR